MRLVFAILFFAVSFACADSLQEKIARARAQADAALEVKSKPKPTQADKTTTKEETKTKKTQSKYVVLESDFVNGMYIGTVGESNAYLEDMKKSVATADKLSSNASKISVAETGIFLIASENANAVSEVKDVAQACEKVFENAFSADYTKYFAKKIEIKIFDKADKPVSVYVSKDVAEISIAWNKSLLLEDFSSALVEVIFRRICSEEKSQCNIPLWLKVGLQYAVLDEVKVGVASHFARNATEQPHKKIVDIFSYSAEDFKQPEKQSHAYFLFKALQRLADKPSLYLFAMNLIQNNISGMQTYVELEKLLSSPSGVNTDLWVGCVMLAEAYSRSGGVLTMSNSELVVLQMSSIRHFVKDEVISVSCDNLEDFSSEIHSEIKLKISEIKFALVKINPVYFNSLRALGLTYEAYLSADKHAYKQRLSEFLDEFNRARNTAKKVEQSMKLKVKTSKLKLD